MSLADDVSEQRVEDALILNRAASLLVQKRDEEAYAELSTLSLIDPIAMPLFEARAGKAVARPKRPSWKREIQVAVFNRDEWRCCYCGRRLVVAGVIALVGKYCPNVFPFPPGHHMPAASTHPAANRVYPNIDHVEAWSLGGAWDDLGNLLTACTPCNERKSNNRGWLRRTNDPDDWSGLAHYYRRLAEREGVASKYDCDWLRALGA